MANALNRRGFLARLGITAGASAVALTGTVIAASASTITEDPALLALGEELVPAIGKVRQAIAAHEAAVDLFHAIRSALPDELRSGSLWTANRWKSGRRMSPEYVEDGYGMKMYDGHRAVCYATPGDIAQERGCYSPKGAMGRRLKRLQAVAEQYEANDAAARDAACVADRASELFDAQYAMSKIGRRMFEIEARTMEGIEIKAGALAAVPLLDMHARGIGSKWGPLIANNLLAVLAGRA